MLFDEMSQIARNVAAQRMSSNMPLSFNDTICVAFTTTSKIYVGVNTIFVHQERTSENADGIILRISLAVTQ